MLLDKVYTDFVIHTNLDDGIYKTVFIKISEVLDSIKDIKWQRLSYAVGDQETITDFTSHLSVPLYVLEIIQNLFHRFFTFPDKSHIQLDLEYKNQNYSIISDDNNIIIPEQIQFIQELSLFKLFLVVTKAYDIFAEFDKLFSFVDDFKLKINSVYEPLLKQFETQTTKESVDVGLLSSKSIYGNQSFIENLKQKRKDLLNTIEVLVKEREELIKDKNNISKILNACHGLEFEYSTLKEEYEELKRLHNDYIQKFDKVLEVIAEIDTELAGLNIDPKLNRDEIEYLKEKKSTFVFEREQIELASKDTKNLLETTEVRLKEINAKLKKASAYSQDDITILVDKIQEYEQRKNDLEMELISVENEIKHQTSKAATDSSKLESISHISVFPSGIKNFSKDIVEHLSNPLQPTSVTVVMNYLRYYFAYHTTNIASKLIHDYGDTNPLLLQTLASRLVLVRCFGVYYNNVFSLIDFSDNRVKYTHAVEA